MLHMSITTTYNSATKGVIKIAEMVTEHIENAVHKLRSSGEHPETLAALETELSTRTTETKVAASA